MPENGDSFQYDVFLAFASSDEEIAKPIWEELCRHNLRVFWSDTTLKQKRGESWVDAIEAALQSSRHFLLIASPSSISSEWVKREYWGFFHRCYSPGIRRLIPLLSRGCKDSDLPLFLQELQTARLEDPNCLQEIIPLLRESPIEDLKKHLIAQREETKSLESRTEKLQEENQKLKADLGKGATTVSPSTQSSAADTQSDNAGFWQRAAHSWYAWAAILLVTAVISVTAGYWMREKVEPAKRVEAKQQLTELHGQLLSVQDAYETFQNTQNDGSGVNSRAKQLVERLLSINDLHLDQFMEIFKYEHLCYAWGIVAETQSNSPERAQASDNMVKACDKAREKVESVKKPIQWMTTDNTDPRITRLSAVGLCVKWQVNRDPADLRNFHAMIDELLAKYSDYFKAEHLDKNGELLPCLRAQSN